MNIRRLEKRINELDKEVTEVELLEKVQAKIEEEELRFVDDSLFSYIPLPQYGKGIYKVQLVMTKEIFQECYNRWIKQ